MAKNILNGSDHGDSPSKTRSISDYGRSDLGRCDTVDKPSSKNENSRVLDKEIDKSDPFD
jgi:hypothetical protein